MTSKLKCPWCGSNMMYSVLGQNLTSSHFCDNKDCKAFQMVLPDFLWEDIFTWKQSQKDLEIATKALEDIKSDYELYAKQGCRMEPNETDMYNYARKALEQINHKE